MRLDPSPVFRKTIVPWYDSETACVIAMVLMLAVFGFSLVGVAVAAESPHYHPHRWVPLLMAVLSAAVFLSTLVRLVRRRASRFTQSEE